VLRLLRPEELIDQEAATALHEILLEFLDAPESVLRPEDHADRYMYYLNQTHAGITLFDRMANLGDLLFEELRSRNLAGEFAPPSKSLYAPKG
jgi:hypothetical protein